MGQCLNDLRTFLWKNPNNLLEKVNGLLNLSEVFHPKLTKLEALWRQAKE